MRKTVLFVDLDNTLYDWPSFFVPSLRTMLSVVADELGTTLDRLYEESRAVFHRHQSLEYAFLIQELESVRGVDETRTARLIEKGRTAFKHAQEECLRPYPGVRETMRTFVEHDVTIVGVTNSPVWRAQQRLYDLELDGFLAGLVAWEGFRPSARDPHVKEHVRKAKRSITRLDLDRVVTVSWDDCKPNMCHYFRALELLRIQAENAWAVGDSVAKDLKPAHSLGIRTVWARYGAGLDRKDQNTQTLLRLTHWDEARIDETYREVDQSFTPDFVIDEFSELMRLVPMSRARQVSAAEA